MQVVQVVQVVQVLEQYQPSMPIEMTSKQMGLERKNTIDNARLFVGIMHYYHWLFCFSNPVCFCSSSCLVITILPRMNILNGISQTSNRWTDF